LGWQTGGDDGNKMVELNGSGALVLPGFFGELSPTGYQAREGMTFEEWKSDGHKLHVVSEASQWAKGDWWAFGGHEYGERAKAAADGIFGIGFGALANYGTTSRSFETSRRRELVPFTFHRTWRSLQRPTQRRPTSFWIRLRPRSGRRSSFGRR
jgi:hypothetical protein